MPAQIVGNVKEQHLIWSIRNIRKLLLSCGRKIIWRLLIPVQPLLKYVTIDKKCNLYNGKNKIFLTYFWGGGDYCADQVRWCIEYQFVHLECWIPYRQWWIPLWVPLPFLHGHKTAAICSESHPCPNKWKTRSAAPFLRKANAFLYVTQQT